MKEMKKVELHLHLEGAAPPAFIRGLAAEKRLDLNGVFTPDGDYVFQDFWQFLNVYEMATSVLQSPEDFARLTSAVLAESASQGVIYTEVFLSPDFCGGGDLAAWQDYLAAIKTAASAARAQGIDMRGIVTGVRHFGPEKARNAAVCAAETAGDFIVGFGLGGDERIGRPKDYAWSFDCAREAGLGLTCHAGEWDGPASVREAWTDLGVSRIGHGVRAVEDNTLLEEMIAAGVVFEVCPGSNVALKLYDNLMLHPIEKMRKMGAHITVSTDDPPYFHTTMTQEYEALHKTFGWDVDIFDQITQTAIDAAFCTSATKQRLQQKFQEA